MPGPSARENGKKGGRPKGTTGILHKSTIDKELHREVLRQLVCAELQPMTLAQIEHAKGIGYMLIRRSDGTMSRATDEKQIDAALAAGGSMFKLFTQAPNVQAYTALMDRALDKPIERQEVTGKDGEPVIFQWRK